MENIIAELTAAPDTMAQLERSYQAVFSDLQQTQEQFEDVTKELGDATKDLAEATKELGIASNELKSAVDYLGKITQENARTTI
jgi:methyl-accepting chemotaxis protein